MTVRSEFNPAMVDFLAKERGDGISHLIAALNEGSKMKKAFLSVLS